MVVNAPVWRLAGRTRRQGDMHRSKYDDADVNPLHYHTLLSKSGLRVLSRVCDTEVGDLRKYRPIERILA
jgi:hypothetical protein